MHHRGVSGNHDRGDFLRRHIRPGAYAVDQPVRPVHDQRPQRFEIAPVPAHGEDAVEDVRAQRHLTVRRARVRKRASGI